MTRIHRYIALALLLALPMGASALTLGEAKSRGLVVERPDGYVAPTAAATPDIRAMVEQINRKRLEAYRKSAEQTGVPVEVIARRMAERLSQKAAP